MQVSQIQYVEGYSFEYESASEIPLYCVLAARFLQEQPIFEGPGLVGKNKVIPLENYDDARIIEIFNRNTEKLLGEKAAWHIYSFGNPLVAGDDLYLRFGLHMWVHKEIERCPLEKLKEACDQVFDLMRNGWERSSPQDHPDCTSLIDLEKFAFFAKKKKLCEEDTLIRFLASKFSLQELIDCEWNRADKPHIYMWINKQELAKVIKIFGFAIDVI